jgi:hypothetical protein
VSDLGEHAATGWALAYLGLLVWQCAGLLDFILHRRADLPHTSGLPESSMHLLQLSLVGAAIVLGMLFDSSLALLATVLLLVALHAAVGYADTRQAFRRRPIVPLEQHVHSVLDMAPWIGLGLLAAFSWSGALDAGWSFQLRQPALPAWVWLLVLLPSALLCGLPALMEWRAAWLARHERPVGSR